MACQAGVGSMRLRTARARGIQGEATFELSDDQASLRGRARDEIELNLLVGGARPAFSCLGKLVRGFAVDLVNKNGRWSWANDK